MLNSEEYNQEQNMLHHNQSKPSKPSNTKYKKSKSNLEDLCNKYTTHIRNLNALDKKMIDNIAIMTDEEKMDIIISLNVVLLLNVVSCLV